MRPSYKTEIILVQDSEFSKYEEKIDICQQPTWRENSITFRKMPEGIKKNSFLKPGGSQMEGTHTMGPSHVLLDMYNSKFAFDLHIILF